MGIKNGGNALMIRSFADHPGQPLEAPKDQDRKKKGGGKTVSSFFKSQLDDLMTTLYKTEPHFIRCVVPNTHKQPGGVESELIMHQYQCNGVLAGIAICRAGFPNKMSYPEFKARYNILGASLVAKAKNDKAAAGAVLDLIKLPAEKFRLGHTKVFFRAGILGVMEETREDKIGSVLSWLQAGARGKTSRMNFKKLQDQKLALYACQRAIRNYFTAKTWLWMQIWLAIKPNLKCTRFGKFKKEYEDKIALAEANIDGAIAERAKVQAVYDGLAGQKNELSLALKSGGSAVQDIIDKTTRIEAQAAEVQNELAGVNNRIKGEKQQKVNLEGQIGKINATVAQLEGEVQNQEGVLKSAEQDRADKDDQIRTLKDEISHQSDMIAKLGKEKRSVGDGRQKTEEDIQAAEDKCNHLGKVKGKLEQALDESEDALEREKKVKGDVEKAKRKIEGDLFKNTSSLEKRVLFNQDITNYSTYRSIKHFTTDDDPSTFLPVIFPLTLTPACLTSLPMVILNDDFTLIQPNVLLKSLGGGEYSLECVIRLNGAVSGLPDMSVFRQADYFRHVSDIQAKVELHYSTATGWEKQEQDLTQRGLIRFKMMDVSLIKGVLSQDEVFRGCLVVRQYKSQESSFNTSNNGNLREKLDTELSSSESEPEGEDVGYDDDENDQDEEEDEEELDDFIQDEEEFSAEEEEAPENVQNGQDSEVSENEEASDENKEASFSSDEEVVKKPRYQNRKEKTRRKLSSEKEEPSTKKRRRVIVDSESEEEEERRKVNREKNVDSESEESEYETDDEMGKQTETDNPNTPEAGFSGEDQPTNSDADTGVNKENEVGFSTDEEDTNQEASTKENVVDEPVLVCENNSPGNVEIDKDKTAPCDQT